MKLETLLLCGGAMVATSAQAALNITERQLVIADPSAMAEIPTDGQTVFYLYNLGVQGFVLGANDHGTRGSFDNVKGYKFKASVEDADNGLVSFTDYVESQKQWKKMFVADANGIWVDNNDGANANTWQIIPGENGKVRITNTAMLTKDSQAMYLGAKKEGGDTRLYMCAEGDGACIEWYAVDEDNYKEANKNRESVVAQFKAAQPLYEILLSADKQGVSGLEDFAAVYANENATVEELNKAVVGVKAAINSHKANSATAENPVDLSDNIVNGTFDKIDDFTGWKGSSFGAGGTTSTCAERYKMTFDTWQQIDNLPNGVYALEVQGFDRPGSIDDAYNSFVNGTNKTVLAYAENIKSGEDAKNDVLTTTIKNIFDGITPEKNDVTKDAKKYNVGGVNYFLPNNMKQAVDYFDAGYYQVSVMFPVTEGSAKIGVKKDKLVGSDDWAIFDNFKIKYYGNGADAYKLWNADLVKNAKEYSEDDQITVSVFEEYNNIKAASAEGTNYEEVMANVAALEAAQKKIEENVAAWAGYVKELENARKIVTSDGYAGDDMDILSEYVEFESSETFGAKQLTTEEVIAETAKLKKMIEDAVQNSIKPNTKLELIQNPDFSKGNEGWTVYNPQNRIVNLNQSAKCAEAFNNPDFDIYQTIENAPIGAYKISVQGFYRRGRGDAAWKFYFNNDGTKRDDVAPSPAYVYCNDMKTPLMQVFDYGVAKNENYYTGDFYTGNDICYPNNMADAGLAFDRGAYKIETTGLVAQKGDVLRIGMKGDTSQENDSWAIFTRFEVTYMGMDAEILKESIVKTVNTIDLEKKMGTDVKEKAQNLIDAANEAAKGDDGKVMCKTLGELLAYQDKIDASVSLFTSLEAAADDFTEYVSEVEGYEELKAEAVSYIEELSDFTGMTDEDANAAIAKIADYRYKLSLPLGWENASDAEPADMTALMKTPSFEKDGANSLEGWQNTNGYNFGNNDAQKAALALEFYDKNFDLYQEIEVPNGTYQVTANAFNRAGSLDADITAVAEGTPSKALLYAKSGETEVTTPVMHLATIDGEYAAASESLGAGNELTFGDDAGNTYYVPDNMVSSANFFDQGRYLNGVTIKVTDGKLRVGIRQADKVSGSWVIMDNFKLMYLGTESEKVEGGFTEVGAIEAADNVAKIEVYSVNGIKLNAIQKGVNIVVITDKAGNVTTKTVIK